MKTKSILITSIAISAIALSSQATNYAGNGASGFGSSVGSGSLAVTDTANSLTFTFNRGSGSMNDTLVVYLDTKAGGFNNNSTFQDNGDGGRTAISGYNAGNPSTSLVTFASGFNADFALSIQNGFIGVFGLASGGNNSLNFQFGAVQSGNANDPSYSITLTSAQMSLIGLTAGSGQSFSLVGSLISTSAYRSNETIGSSTTVAGDGSGNAGFNNSQTFTASNVFTLTSVPEPSSLAFFGLSGAALLVGLRRRK